MGWVGGGGAVKVEGQVEFHLPSGAARPSSFHAFGSRLHLKRPKKEVNFI